MFTENLIWFMQLQYFFFKLLWGGVVTFYRPYLMTWVWCFGNLSSKPVIKQFIFF